MLNRQVINKYKVALALLFSLGVLGYVHSQLETNMLVSRVDISKPAVRVGDKAQVTIYIKNSIPKRTITLKATATYWYAGQQYTAESNEVILNVIDAMSVDVSLGLGSLRYVENSASFDGNPVTPELTNNNIIAFKGIELINDDTEHRITFEVQAVR